MIDLSGDAGAAVLVETKWWGCARRGRHPAGGRDLAFTTGYIATSMGEHDFVCATELQ